MVRVQLVIDCVPESARVRVVILLRTFTCVKVFYKPLEFVSQHLFFSC